MHQLDQKPEIAVEDKLSFIKNMLDTGEYAIAVKECCSLFELVFRKIFQQAIISLPYQERNLVLGIENKIGKGNKGVYDFTFGELVGLFRESKLLDKWAKHTSKDLGLIKSVDFSSVVELRNSLIHQGATCRQNDALIVFDYLRNLLAYIGFFDLEESINQSFNNNDKSVPDETKKEPEKESLDRRLPKIRLSIFGKSVYTSTPKKERNRLQIQGLNARDIDLRSFKKVLDEIENKGNLVGLDLGCATGFVTHDRFHSFSDDFKKVIGLDCNEEVIKAANEKYQNDKFSFHTADIEAMDFEDVLDEILGDEAGFDIIFSSLTIHHLANPTKALLKLRKLLKRGGYIILRGSDDGSKIAYPDEQNLVESIIQLTMDVKGVSDRENGRKLYNQLWKSGFRDIFMDYQVKDTSKMNSEERYNLFEESFSYRKNYFKKRLDQDPTNVTFQEEYEWILTALEELELLFLDASFYYSEMDYVAISQK